MQFVVNIYMKFLKTPLSTFLDTNACLQQNTYERLITTTAATIISASGNENILKSFEDLLLNGILGESMMRALMSCDVMCIIFRYAVHYSISFKSV